MEQEQSARSAEAGIELENVKETQFKRKETSYPVHLTFYL